MTIETPDSNCPNCGNSLKAGDLYCSQCGQKQSSRYPAFREIITDFFDSVLNINSKLYRSIGNLIVPGQLTIRYFQGMRAAFYPPIRLFFIAMLLFYTIMGLQYFSKLDTLNVAEQISEPSMRAGDVKEQILRLRENISERPELYESQRALLDSLEASILRDDLRDDTLNNKSDSPVISEGGLRIRLSSTMDSLPVRDIITEDPDTLFQKYNITRPLDKLLIRQFHRMMQDTGDMIKFLVGNTTWMLIGLIPFVALGMKLLYFRKRRYYIEHVVFLFHYHAFAFLCLILFFSLIHIIPSFTGWILMWLLLGYLWAAMYRYYQNGVLHTTFKCILILGFYLLTLFLFFITTGIISFLIF